MPLSPAVLSDLELRWPLSRLEFSTKCIFIGTLAQVFVESLAVLSLFPRCRSLFF